jgi:ketosteroid isomerase-like protein
MSELEIEALARRYFDAINTENWDALRPLWRTDATFTAVGARTRNGPDEIVALFQKLFVPWAEHDDQPTRFITQGNTTAVEVLFIGKTHDGRPVEFSAFDVIDVEDGQIRALTNWYDIAHVRRILEG